MNPLPSVRQAYTSVVQEEKQRELGAAHGNYNHGCAWQLQHV
jgi:predicted metal-binding membrane protein